MELIRKRRSSAVGFFVDERRPDEDAREEKYRGRKSTKGTKKSPARKKSTVEESCARGRKTNNR